MNHFTIQTAIFMVTIATVSSNNPPRFINFPSVAIQPEDAPANTVLGTLYAEDEDSSQLTFGIVGDLAQSIIRLGPTTSLEKIFQCEIILKGNLDRETVPRYFLSFSVSDGPNTIQKSATLYVTDVNDNAPSFTNLPYRANIKETAENGTSVFKVSATDPDEGYEGSVEYSMKTPTTMFTIQKITGEVTLNGNLNFADKSFYQLEIMAQDRGVEIKLNSTTDLVINVENVQSRPPIFLNRPYVSSVKENVAVEKPVIQVTAMDRDTGVPNQVNYTIVGDNEWFQIDNSSGWISVKSHIDREEQSILNNFGVIEFDVFAQEVTDTPMGITTATAKVTINILDENDNTPTFSQDWYNATVQENTQLHVPITFIPAGLQMGVTDLDEGESGTFDLSVEQGTVAFTVFSVEPNTVRNDATLLIRVENSTYLDYEQRKSVMFQIWAKETGTPEKHENFTMVYLEIEDMNDNIPQFTKEEYKTELYENSPKGTNITTITATDADSGEFGKITYSIRGSGANMFHIDPDSGNISVAVDADLDHDLLDREKQDTYYLTLQARDGGNQRNTVQLEIQLLDVNDNAPSIRRSKYEAYVRENQPTLERPVIVEAEDKDLTPNNIIEYSIIESSDPHHNFTIDNTTGRIDLSGPLDYDTMDPQLDGKYNLVVLAVDKGIPPLNSTVEVLVNVEDENDNQPYFNSTEGHSVSIPENTTGGNKTGDTKVAVVKAYDDDRPGTPNSDIIYRIDSGSQDKYGIEANTGLIYVYPRANLDRDAFGESYTLHVLAIDRGTPPQTGSTIVEINITDINNKIPEFNPASKEAKVFENATLMTIVTDYPASDLDWNADLKYEILKNETVGLNEFGSDVDNAVVRDLFDVYANNGSVYVKSGLDREAVQIVTLTLQVTDKNGYSPKLQQNTAILVIELLDVNDNPPEFQPSNIYMAAVSEASSVGATVTKVDALDRDKNNGQMAYRIEDDPFDTFQFKNEFSGEITLRKLVDHETHHWMNFTIMAIDSGTPALNSTASIHVRIEDTNDNSPEFTMFNTSVMVWENATLGTEVTTVEAVDKDSGNFGTVWYLITGHEEKFTIHNETGVITVAGELDRETKADYTISVEARDSPDSPENEQRITSRTMMIRLRDVNDFTPKFAKSNYNASSVAENAATGTQVITITAIDLDEGENARIVYSLNQTRQNMTAGLFEVVPDTGTIKVASTLRTTLGWVYMTLVATDSGTPALSSFTTVHVYIEDVNDNAPVFTHPPANETIFVLENITIGSFITQVKAKDNDIGVNGEVEYTFIKDEPIKDYKKFNLDKKSGNITLKERISREDQEIYFLSILASDKGDPVRTARRPLNIKAIDINDNPPSFDRRKYPTPYSLQVQEEKANITVGNLSLATDPDEGVNAEICYYIVGGDPPKERAKFHLNQTSGILTLQNSIDRETTALVTLIIKANEKQLLSDGIRTCDNQEFVNKSIEFNEEDTSLLKVQVEILDIDDNPPKFTKTGKYFTAGVTKDTQAGEPILDFKDYTFDPDIGQNSIMRFYIEEPINMTGSLRSELNGEKPFRLDQNEGVLYTNVFFKDTMVGFFDFFVFVNGTNPGLGNFDKATVSIYLLNENQQVRVEFRSTPQEVGLIKDIFAEFLGNITGWRINVDQIQTHKDAKGNADDLKTDMFIHAIDKDGNIVDATLLVQKVDENSLALNEFFRRYNVIKVVEKVQAVRAGSTEGDLLLALILVSAVLGFVCLILCIVFLTCRKKYKRKIRAATAMAFGSRDDLNRLHVPGTNQHNYEGSNPIWMEQYDGPWTEEMDSDSQNSQNSLDINVVDQKDKKNPNIAKLNPYDEQELTLNLNDDNEGVNGEWMVPPTSQGVYLDAALSDFDTIDSHKKNGSPTVSTEMLPNAVPRRIDLTQDGLEFDNPAYQLDDSVKFGTKRMNGMQITEI
ncbi:unnamed protein product [Owenia fusiformis]|uniref:Uncharacterized protein n=1 Tax=Owenia fusiformis TaxID=6347 RepID=A0A8J1U5F8_OWEFU|nr:unnamed protein product [Owenia fusiformis]